ncbi:Cof-type HAD-IIB family hydrolase [Metamycoplasma buccale]|uniref:Cof-type HAD-IIB family hydrolase n=1 Tax=Metamycoplasma buccale TaxID=55602 RepID=UPI00398ECA1D
MKLITFDLDGTLLKSNQTLSKKIIEKLLELQKQGHKIAFVTGRGYKNTEIFYKYFKPDFAVLNNGADIYNLITNEVFIPYSLSIKETEMANEIAKKEFALFSISTNLNFYAIMEYCKNENFLTAEDKKYFSLSKHYSFSEAINDITSKQEIILQIALRQTEENIKNIAKKYDNLFPDLSKRITSRVFWDLNGPHISKYTGIEKILNILNITNENLISFGDSNNDIPMLEKAKYSFAMQNATTEVKKIVSEILDGDCNSDAIYNKILELQNNKIL